MSILEYLYGFEGQKQYVDGGHSDEAQYLLSKPIFMLYANLLITK